MKETPDLRLKSNETSLMTLKGCHLINCCAGYFKTLK